MKKLTLLFALILTVLSVHSQNNCLVLDLPFNNNANDASGNNYHGVVKNAVLTKDRFGNDSSAYYFNGESSWIDIENPKKLNQEGSKFSISVWYKPISSNYYNTVIAHGGAHFFIQLIDDLNPAIMMQGVEFDYKGASSYYERLVLDTTTTTTSWTHMVCTFDGKNEVINIFLNGELAYSGSAKGQLKWKIEDWRIGARISSNFTEYFKGSIDDIKAYNCVLDSNDVKDLFDESSSPKKCLAQFKIQRDSLDTCDYVFTNSSKNITEFSEFYWSMGDDSYYEAKHVKHSYAESKNYEITLYVSDTTINCSSSFSQKIDVIGCQKETSCSKIINGQVYAGNSRAKYATVYLIKKTGNILNSVDTTVIDSFDGSFKFNGVCKGEYFLKAALLPNDNNYKDYIPTYYISELRWDSSEVISVTGNYYGADIELIKASNVGGRGFVGGSIKKGANKKEGEYLKDVQVLITDLNWVPITYTYSNEEGRFELANLANGSYYVFAEIPGLFSDIIKVIISDSSQTINDLEIEVNENRTTSSYTPIWNNSFSTFPNPIKNQLNISSDFNITNFSIYSVTGVEVASGSPHSNEFQIQLNNFESGVYILMLNFENGQLQTSRIVKE